MEVYAGIRPLEKTSSQDVARDPDDYSTGTFCFNSSNQFKIMLILCGTSVG